jgi:5'-deoxynucleotidase YfbR-like HD superfamily hydrolase
VTKLVDKILSSKALAGRVKRWHCFPVLHHQTVGEHTQRVATLFLELWGIPRAEVLVYVLHHDLGELYSGDSPFSAKRDFLELKAATDRAEKYGQQKLGITMPELSEEEWMQFKLADLLEMMEFAMMESQLGNRYAYLIIGNVEKYIKKIDVQYKDLMDKALHWIENKRNEEYI